MLEEIEIPVWYNPGKGMMYNRDYLPGNHPEQTYNYVKRVYRVNPELYGIETPLDAYERCERTREVLRE